MTRRTFIGGALAAASAAAGSRRWRLGLNTYCLRFQKWNDRQLIDYCVKQKLDAMFLQDSLDPAVMDPKHWADVRAWVKDAGLHIETGGSALLPKSEAVYAAKIAELRKNIERAHAMGSPIVRTLLASDRYHMPDEGPVERHVETAMRILRELKSQVMDAGMKIGIENHKDLQAWQTRELIVAAGKEFVGSYLDTGNPVFVAEHPLTTVEELGPYAVCFHLRDSVVYEVPDGIAVKWVPLARDGRFQGAGGACGGDSAGRVHLLQAHYGAPAGDHPGVFGRVLDQVVSARAVQGSVAVYSVGQAW